MEGSERYRTKTENAQNFKFLRKEEGLEYRIWGWDIGEVAVQEQVTVFLLEWLKKV